MTRAYFIVAWTLVLVALIGLGALWLGGLREPRPYAWRDAIDVESV